MLAIVLQFYVPFLLPHFQDAELARLREIETIYDADAEKHAKLRQVLARKNQEIAAVVRAIDDIPTRAELIQYERRFVELYQLVSEKLKETRKYFALYNTLDDTRTYLSREVSLIDSIQKVYAQSMKTPAGKEALLSQFKQILDGVAKTADKVDGDYAFEREVQSCFLSLARKSVASFTDELFSHFLSHTHSLSPFDTHTHTRLPGCFIPRYCRLSKNAARS